MKTKITLLAMAIAVSAAPMAMAQQTQHHNAAQHNTQRTTASDPARTEMTQNRNQMQGQNQGADRPDAWVHTKVKAKFTVDGEVSSSDIDVSVNNGIVSLTGTVATEAEKQEAIRMARETEGVKSVNANGLRTSAVGADARRMDRDHNKNNDR